MRDQLRKQTLRLSGVIVALLLLAPPPAVAQPTCGPGSHWIDACTLGGTDTFTLSGTTIEIDTDFDSLPEITFVVGGPTIVDRRVGTLDDSINFPGSSPVDGHPSGPGLDVIDTEMISMMLTNGVESVTAGAGEGVGPLLPVGGLPASLGTIVEHSGSLPGFPTPSGLDSTLGDSFFHVFLEIDLGGGTFLYNCDPFIMCAVIDEVPPFATEYGGVTCDPSPFVDLYTTPTCAGGTLFGQEVGHLHDTEVSLASFTATAMEGRSVGAENREAPVLLQWRTGYELDNLGFHLYREDKGLLRRLNPSLIAGSALMAGVGTELTAGRSYAWWDSLPDSSGAVKYWLEEVDLNGERTWHGPIDPVPEEDVLPGIDAEVEVDRLEPGTANALLLSQLGRDQAPLRPMAATRRVPYSAPPSKGGSGQIETQWELATDPAAMKLAVREQGWIRVTQAELLAAGLDPAVDPRNLQLFVDGVEQAIRVRGERDGSFDPSDAVEFFGSGLDTAWADRRVYWLVAGSQPGRRIKTTRGSRPVGLAPASFRQTVELKERYLYFGGLSNGDTENFFGQLIEPSEPVDQTLTLRHLDPAAPGKAALEVVLQGVTTGEHSVAIQLNGTGVGTALFAGQAHDVTSLKVAHSLLQEGGNVVTLTAQGGDADVSLVDTIRIRYWHTYSADDDALRFTAPARKRVVIDGFNGRNIRVLDVTDPSAVVGLAAAVERLGPANYAVVVTPGGSGQRTLLAVRDTDAAQVAAITPNQPSSWHSADNQAQLVILGHGSLLAGAQALKDRRESEGWSVAMVDVEDLYDEFNFGVKSPYAIRDFLTRAVSEWSTPPDHLLLLGDASLDPRNYRNSGKEDLVPTKFVETATFDSASDDWFVDLDADGLAELAVGRVPVRSLEESAAVIGKLIDYELADPAESWTGEVLLVADDNDTFDFEVASNSIAEILPAELSVEKIYLGQSDLPSARAQLLDALDQGQLLVNYVGHGGVGFWAAERLLSAADVAGLGNAPRMPFVVTMNCSNGYFNSIFEDSLAAALITADGGGAVAAWASSGLTLPDRQLVMNHLLVERLFAEPAMTLGQATIGAKEAIGDPDLRRTWILFGDPTMRLKGAGD